MAHHVLAVANEFLARGFERRVPLTPMHLQKLCYMAQGFSLAFSKEPLIEERVQAWAYGPVYQVLYDAAKHYGSGPVTEFLRERYWALREENRGEPVREKFSDDEVLVIDGIFNHYARFPAFKLSALTHEAGTPWSEVYQQGQNSIIPDELTKQYFSDLAV